MSVSSASRFSVLKIEDDDYYTDSSDEGCLKRKPKNVQLKNAKTSQEKAKAKKKKKKPIKEVTDQLDEPSSAISSKPNKSSTKQSRGSHDRKQWEEWVQKDAEFVSDTYESDLQQALLLSKLEFEEKKDFYDAVKQEEEERANKKKKKKAKPILTLNELNSFHEASSSAHSKGDSNPPPDDCTNFFEQIEVATEEIINKEIRDVTRRKSEPFEVEKIRIIEYKDQLLEKEKEISDLKDELTDLRKELDTTKHKKKLFAKLLREGEMHEKATLLVQIEQLTKLKDDLTEQLTELHTALEQERSKVHALQMELKKYQIQSYDSSEQQGNKPSATSSSKHSSKGQNSRGHQPSLLHKASLKAIRLTPTVAGAIKLS